MALAFNVGTNKQLVVTKFGVGSYGKQTVYTDYRNCGWPMESMVPFNIVPFVNEFIGDNTKSFFTLMKRSGTSRVYGIRITQQNDVIKVYFSTTTNGSTYTDHIEAATFTINSIPSSYSIYFGYNNYCDSTGWGMWIFTGQVYLVTLIDMQISGHNEVVEDTAVLTQVNQVPVSTKEPTRPYNYNLVYIDPLLFADQPLSVIGGMVMSSGLFDGGGYILNFSGSSDMSNFTDASDNPPSPYIPPTPPTPSDDPFEPSAPSDYDPDIDDTSDLIDIPGNPTIGVTGAGFINVYNPSMGSLQGLGDILFPNVASATDIVDAVIKLCETLANQNLINYVIDCHVIPVTPQIGTNANIKVGFRDTGISVPKVTSDYIDATCGSLNLAEYFTSFADYLYTRSKLYLPFVGFVDMKPEYWQAGTLSVDYKFNVIDGSFMCYVRSISSKSQLNGSVIAQYAGNACMHFPITGVNYSAMVSGLIGAGIAAASGAGTASAVLGQAYSAANTFAQGGDVQQSNGYNSTAALMGVRTPYLLIERPVPSYPSGYGHSKGYPSNIATLLSNVTGFTIIDDIDLSGIPFTEVELNELRTLLKEGVYF